MPVALFVLVATTPSLTGLTYTTQRTTGSKSRMPTAQRYFTPRSMPCLRAARTASAVARASTVTATGSRSINGDNTEIKGNMVYDILSTAAMIVGDGGDPGATTSNLDVQNNIFYTPATGLTVQLWNVDGLELHNNVIWGRPQGDRYGGIVIRVRRVRRVRVQQHIRKHQLHA